jgi:hypothetical protein
LRENRSSTVAIRLCYNLQLLDLNIYLSYCVASHNHNPYISIDSNLLVLEVLWPIERFLLLNIYNKKELAEDSIIL